MAADIDAALRALATADHPALDTIEATVIARVHARRASRAAMRTAALAGVGAIVFGVLAAGPGSTPASAAAGPLGLDSPLAPSTLLLGEG